MFGIPLTVLAAVVAVILAAAAVFTMKRFGELRGDGGSAGSDDGDVCGICFGVLDDIAVKCGCGRLFHRGCGESVGSCPYCAMPCSEFEDAGGERTRCPNCGRYVMGRECLCGALLMRDGFFVCSCGARIVPGESYCMKCGKGYAKGGD